MWDGSVLRWVDIEGHAIRCLHPDGSVTTTPTPDRPGCVVLDAEGRQVVGFPDGVHREADHGWKRLVALDADDPTTRLNDGKVAPDGRLVVGTMVDDQAARRGWLWAVSADGSAEVLLDGVAVSNGLAWSADGGSFFWIDTPSRKVRRWAWPPDGPLGPGEVVVRVPRDHGFPDGMAIDDDGCLWVAMWGGSAVRRYAPDGRLDAVVSVPTPNVTSCAFGGPDRTTLYVTTASVGLGLGDDATLSGALFAVDVGVSGPLPTRFGATA